MSQNRQTSSTPLFEYDQRVPLLGTDDDWEPDSLIPPHHHNLNQLIFAISGVMTIETEAGIWVVPPTRAVWVPAGEGHSIQMSGVVKLRTLQFEQGLAPIEGAGCRVVQVSQLLKAAILRTMEFQDNYAEDSPSTRLTRVILDEITAARTAPLHLPIPGDERAKRVALAIQSDPSVRKSCKEWAAETGASPRTLERLFRTETGMSFGKWQQQMRLLRALQVLATGDSVTNAAFEVGFKTPSAFISMFRKAMGETPHKYYSDSADPAPDDSESDRTEV
jgi:AraC-like DNA-binding protein